MVIWSSFEGGIKNIWENKLLALILFLFKLFFAILLLIPAYYMFARTFSFSPTSVNFLKGYDFYLLVDFLSQWSRGRSLYWVYFLSIGLISTLSYIFFSGGIWGALLQSLKEGRHRFKGEKYFKDCIRYFVSFLKISIFILICYMIVFFFALLIFSLIHAAVGKELSYTSRILIIIAEFLILAILFMWVNMWSNYLRIYRVFFEESKLILLLKSSFKFIIRNFVKTVLLYYLLSVILVGTLMVYLGLNKILHLLPVYEFLIISLFVLYQLQSFFRSFYKLVYYSSHMVLFDKLYELK